MRNYFWRVYPHLSAWSYEEIDADDMRIQMNGTLEFLTDNKTVVAYSIGSWRKVVKVFVKESSET